MARLNRLEVIGHLGGDPELKYTQNQKAVCNLSIAVNTGQKQQDGSWSDETMWVRASVWNEAGERTAEQLKKGNLVFAEGQLNVRDWQDDNGKDRYSIELKFARVMSLERRPRDGDEQPAREPVGAALASSAPMDVDDIPF
jgi:single-strand DNA-binding protein